VRIGLVCPYDLAAPGGVQHQVAGLADRLRKDDHEVVVVGPSSSPAAEGVVRLGDVIRVEANGSTVPIMVDLRGFQRAREALSGVDVVHVHEPLMPLAGWCGLRTSGTNRVLTFHADPGPAVRRAYRVLGRFWPRPSGVLTAVSRAAAGALPWDSVSIVPNGIDVGSYRVATERFANRVAFLGRDEPRKGLDVLLAAWPSVVGAIPEAELVVIGARRSESIPSVRFLGRVDEDEKRRMLASSTFLVTPNLGGESFGIVGIEALAAGAVVVASDLPGFREALGDAAILIPPGDVKSLALTLVRLIRTQEEVALMRRRGENQVEAFDWPVVSAGYIEAYRRALGIG
jgi:phosphatidylinositol alpha-mannosyltransferase